MTEWPNLTLQLQIVRQCLMDEIRFAVMCVCLAALAVFAAGCLFHYVFEPAWRWLRIKVPFLRFRHVLLVVFSAGMIHYGSTKGWAISFDGGIKQNSVQPSVVSNSTVEIHWMRDTSQGVYVPETATVYIDYREIADTNGVWQSLGSTTVGEWHYSTMLSNATNYNYNVWAYYIPPEPVHTNGVWIYKTLKDRSDKYPIPLRARIEVNGKAIANPKEKRRDE